MENHPKVSLKFSYPPNGLREEAIVPFLLCCERANHCSGLHGKNLNKIKLSSVFFFQLNLQSCKDSLQAMKQLTANNILMVCACYIHTHIPMEKNSSHLSILNSYLRRTTVFQISPKNMMLLLSE